MPLIFGNVVNIATASNPDAANLPFGQGRQTEILASEVHGKFYTANYRGNLFFATTATAGTTIPAGAASLVSTFTLYNPLGSGKNCELVAYDAVMEAATTVVSDVSLYFQIGLVIAPTNLTALTIRNGIIGGGLASVVSFYSSASLAGAITTLIKGPTLFGPTAVTSTQVLSNHVDFDGKIIIPPGVLATVAGNAAQSAASSQSMFWSEWPI